MSRKLYHQVIVPKGLDWSSRNDAGDPDRPLTMVNIRPARGGYIQTRWGLQAVSAGVPATIHTIYQDPHGFVWAGSGTALYRDGSSLVTGLNGEALHLAKAAGFVWITNRGGVRRKHTAGGLFNWWIAPPAAAPTAAAGDAGSPNGTYRYYVTFANDYGQESNPSPAVTVTATNEEVDLASIPISGDGQVRIRHIYRIGGTLEGAFRVGTIDDNTTTTFTDNKSDEDAAVDNLTMPTDHDEPPAARGVAGPYLGRLLLWNTTDNPSHLFWTPVNKHWYVPAENYEPVGEDGEDILAVTIHKNWVGLYKAQSVHRLIGHPEPGVGKIEQLDSSNGLAGPKAITTVGDVDYFYGDHGIYRNDGDSLVKVSGALDPLFLFEQINTGNPAVSAMPPDGINKSRSTMAGKGSRVYFSYPRAGQTDPSDTLVLDLDEGRWSQDSRGFSALTAGQDAVLGARSGNPGVYYLDFLNTNDAGAAIPLHFQGRYFDGGLPNHTKVFTDVVITHSTNSKTLAVTALTDGGPNVVSLGNISSATRTQTVLLLNSGQGVRAKSLAIALNSADASGAEIHSIELRYYVEPAARLSLLTEPTDWGSAHPKECRALQLDIDVGGSTDVALLADGAGGELSSVFSTTISSDAGRKVYRWDFTPQLGRNWVVRVSSAAPFQVWNARVHGRPIPNVLQPGQKFETPVIGS